MHTLAHSIRSGGMADRDTAAEQIFQYSPDPNPDAIERVDLDPQVVHETSSSSSDSQRTTSFQIPSEPSFSSSSSSGIPPNVQERLSAKSAQSFPDNSSQEYEVFPQEPWEHCRKLVSGHDSEMCGAWKAELDNLLIFAGLFSAAVTAFTIDSYKWLQQDSAQYNAQVLALIYQELNPTTSGQRLSGISNILPQDLVIRINIYWFLSLSLGLATVLIGIIVSQWLREYQREISLSSQERLSLRQMRYEGLVFWQVPRIISFLPLFLQFGFIIFLVGILELLWYINKSVAIAITIPIGLVFLFLVATVVLPTIQYVFIGGQNLRIPQCPYKSPQSLGILRFTIFLSTLFPRSWKQILSTRPNMERLFSSSYSWSWQHFDAFWRKLRETSFSTTRSPLNVQSPYDIVKSLTWLVDNYDETSENVLSTLHCLHHIPFNSAVQVVIKTWIDLGLPRLEDVYNLLHNNNTLTPKTNQDIITVAFLHGYQRSHPTLRTIYWISHIRLMRNKSIPRHLVDWYGTDISYADLPPGLQLRLLKSFNGLVETNLATPLDIQNIWQIVHSLLNSELFEIEEGSEFHIAWCFKLFESLEVWLTAPPRGDSDLLKRAMLSMDGIRMVVDPGLYGKWGSCPDYDKFLNFVRNLNSILETLEGPHNPLCLNRDQTFSPMEDTWATYMDWIFSEA